MFTLVNHLEARNLATFLSTAGFDTHYFAEDYYTSKGLAPDLFKPLEEQNWGSSSVSGAA